jgi:hypothetical protein
MQWDFWDLGTYIVAIINLMASLAAAKLKNFFFVGNRNSWVRWVSDGKAEVAYLLFHCGHDLCSTLAAIQVMG